MNPAHLKAPHNLRTVWDSPCRFSTSLSPEKSPENTFVIQLAYQKSFIDSPCNGVRLDPCRHAVDRA